MSSRRAWTQREDESFKKLAAEYETKDWAVIAKRLHSQFNFRKRTGKQCRQRWFNHLDPQISKKGWTKNEEQLLLQLHKSYGNKWTVIAEHMPGRSDNSIKNYFYSTVRRNLRRMSKLLGSKNSTGLMRQIKPSTMTRIFGSINEEEDESLLMYLQQEGLTKDFLKKSCQDIRNEIIQFSYYKPKKNDKIEPEERQKYERVFWLLKKVNEIYERVRKEERSNRTEKQIFRAYYQEMKRQESQQQEESESFFDEDEQGSSNSSKEKRQATPVIFCKTTRTQTVKSPITINIISEKNLKLPQFELEKHEDKAEDQNNKSQSLARGSSTLDNIVDYAEQYQFNDPEFNIDMGDEMQRSNQMNNLEVHMSNMSFRSPAFNFGTPLSQINFFKSPRSIKITCLSDYLKLSGSGNLEKYEEEKSNNKEFQ